MLFLSALWLLLPAGFANMSPILAKKIFPKWNTPLDNGKTWRHKQIFGSHKTYRGLVSGTVIGFVVFYLQQILFAKFPVISNLSNFDYQTTSPLFGAAMGLSALLGDLIKSFFKRRLNIAPGKPWIPFDEIDWIVGALICVTFIFKPDFNLVVSSLIVGVSSHFIIRRISYLLHFVTSPL